MKIYIAARFERQIEARNYAVLLEAAGHIITSRWLYVSNAADLAVEAAHDLEDVDAADALIFLSESPETAWRRGSRCVEYGYALARGKRLRIIGPRENIFHWLLPDAAFFLSIDALVEALNDLR